MVNNKSQDHIVAKRRWNQTLNDGNKQQNEKWFTTLFCEAGNTQSFTGFDIIWDTHPLSARVVMAVRKHLRCFILDTHFGYDFLDTDILDTPVLDTFGYARPHFWIRSQNYGYDFWIRAHWVLDTQNTCFGYVFFGFGYVFWIRMSHSYEKTHVSVKAPMEFWIRISKICWNPAHF